jgi:hypothetical protein
VAAQEQRDVGGARAKLAVEGILESYSNSSNKQKALRVQLLYLLCTPYTRKEVNRMLQEQLPLVQAVPAALWRAAIRHRTLVGAGCAAPAKKKQFRRRIKPVAVKKAIKLTASKKCCQMWAPGTRDLLLTSAGEVVTMPNCTRPLCKEDMYSKYLTTASQDAAGQAEDIIQRGAFYKLVEMATGREATAALRALDSVYVKCALDNFRELREVIHCVTQRQANMRTDLLQQAGNAIQGMKVVSGQGQGEGGDDGNEEDPPGSYGGRRGWGGVAWRELLLHVVRVSVFAFLPSFISDASMSPSVINLTSGAPPWNGPPSIRGS